MPVLGTKLHVPAMRRRLVPRPRLTDRLRVEPTSMPRLVLVSAPAGFGKTTLVAQWLAPSERGDGESEPGGLSPRVAWLPLARLRGRGELLELRAADLRFTAGEADAFLNHVMGLDLDPAHVAALEHRTEGWAAGLQLAALSARGRTDAGDPGGVAGFVDAFTGSHRFVLDYLV